MGFSPTGKRRPFTAHTHCGHSEGPLLGSPFTPHPPISISFRTNGGFSSFSHSVIRYSARNRSREPRFCATRANAAKFSMIL
jgi:hypothetical protein